MIPFNKPYIIGNELEYIKDAVYSGKLSGNGKYTQLCHEFFVKRYGFKKVLLTNSCTAALEMAAILLRIQEGDEVIMPSYTFVSTANAFILHGAKIVFADSSNNSPNMDISSVAKLITNKTKAIVVVHYGGVAVDMDEILRIAKKHNLYVVEDAAHSIESNYKGKPLGSLGHIAAFSFHETKNIISGEGGLLVVNDEQFIDRAEIIWEKGTNRTAFFRGEVDKYGWVDIGSSFLPGEVVAAFLFAQLEKLELIQNQRIAIWDYYYEQLKPLSDNGYFEIAEYPEYASKNGHLFYLVCRNEQERSQLLEFLKDEDIKAVFHYLCLHSSNYYKNKHDNRELPNCKKYSDCLVRLPLFYTLTREEQEKIIKAILNFYKS